MKKYLRKSDVDDALGNDWAPEDKKDRAVMMANVWLTSQNLPDIEPIPEEWVLAGCEVAKEASTGRLYAAMETGVLSKAVQAGDVSSSKTFTATAKAYTAGERLALALLKPWLPGIEGVQFLKRV